MLACLDAQIELAKGRLKGRPLPRFDLVFIDLRVGRKPDGLGSFSSRYFRSGFGRSLRPTCACCRMLQVSTLDSPF